MQDLKSEVKKFLDLIIPGTKVIGSNNKEVYFVKKNNGASLLYKSNSLSGAKKCYDYGGFIGVLVLNLPGLNINSSKVTTIEVLEELLKTNIEIKINDLTDAPEIPSMEVTDSPVIEIDFNELIRVISLSTKTDFADFSSYFNLSFEPTGVFFSSTNRKYLTTYRVSDAAVGYDFTSLISTEVIRLLTGIPKSDKAFLSIDKDNKTTSIVIGDYSIIFENNTFVDITSYFKKSDIPVIPKNKKDFKPVYNRFIYNLSFSPNDLINILEYLKYGGDDDRQIRLLDIPTDAGDCEITIEAGGNIHRLKVFKDKTHSSNRTKPININALNLYRALQIWVTKKPHTLMTFGVEFFIDFSTYINERGISEERDIFCLYDIAERADIKNYSCFMLEPKK